METEVQKYEKREFLEQCYRLTKEASKRRQLGKWFQKRRRVRRQGSVVVEGNHLCHYGPLTSENIVDDHAASFQVFQAIPYAKGVVSLKASGDDR
ncbi:hypothetical protein C5167_030272 [Papaver somniferum]|nr:hypothetical protein C5167_030272 [Papaver somniferum]